MDGQEPVLVASDLEGIKSFVDNAPVMAVGAWFAGLAKDRSSASLALLRSSLLVRADDMYGKHYVPRIAAWALIMRGPEGIAILRELATSDETPGAIYPAAIVDSLWSASVGRWPLLSGTAAREMGVQLGAVDDGTRAAAREAIIDVVAESPFNPEVFDRVIGVAYSNRVLPDARWMQDDFLTLLTRATIKISPSLLDEFESMLGAGLPEEQYQVFLSSNPVLLDPLASSVTPKQRLGTEYATDFVVRTLDDRYVMVEIERPDTPILTQGLDFTAGFTHAFGQVIDFQRWVEDNAAYADRHMPGVASPRGLLVIGLRSELSADGRRKLRRFVANSATIDVLGFDELLARGRHLYVNLTRHGSGGPPSASGSGGPEVPAPAVAAPAPPRGKSPRSRRSET